MPFNKLRFACAALLCAALAAAQDPAAGLDAITKRVDAKYSQLNTLSADFTERYSGAGVARQETGSVILKRGGRMRWDFTAPKTKLFVTDGKTAYFYVPVDRQVRKASVKKLDDLHSPLRYLLGRSKLHSEFEGLTLEPAASALRPGNAVLSGVPKRLKDRVERVLLEISPASLIERIVIEETDGSVTEFRFANLVENRPVPDDHFRFRPPPGVETIESAELTGP